MKIAGGCFGCLTLILLGCTLVLSFGSAFILEMLTSIDPTLAGTFAGAVGILSQVSGACCCFSSLAAVILLAIGFSSGGKAEDGA